MLRRGPGKAERVAQKVSKKTMGFLEFLFTWIGHAWDKVSATIGRVWNHLFQADLLLGLVVVVAVTGVGAVLFNAVRADGTIKFCRISPSTDMYVLTGHIDWGFDPTAPLLKVKTKEEALAWAKTIGCPIR